MRWFYRTSSVDPETLDMSTVAVAHKYQLNESASESIMADKGSLGILRVLARRKSMPHLELRSVSNVGDDELENIIRNLEREEIVKVSYRGDITEEIITLKHKGFNLVSLLGF